MTPDNNNLTVELEKTVAEEIGTMRLEIIKLRLIGQRLESRASEAERELTSVKIENAKLRAASASKAPSQIIGAPAHVD